MIVGGYVDWRLTHPRIIITVDGDLFTEEINKTRFTQIRSGSNSSLFIGKSPQGFVSLFYHNPNDETGFGGRVFEFPMEDGTIVKRKGVWATNADFYNSWTSADNHVVDVVLHLIGKSINMHCFLPVKLVLEVLQKSFPTMTLTLEDNMFCHHTYIAGMSDRDTQDLRIEAYDRQDKKSAILQQTWVQRMKHLKKKRINP